MKDYKTTLDRLIQILYRLYLGDILSVKDLSEEFGVSQRTIQRYFNNYLKDFPLKKIGKKWALDKEIFVDENTKIAFEAIENVVQKMGIYPKIEPYLAKLKEVNHNIFFTTLKMETINESFDKVVKLDKAIKNKKFISFFYKNEKFDEIEPIKITNFEGYWYLLGFEIDEYKSFYIKEMRDIKILHKNFVSNEIPNIQNAINAWFNPHVKEIEVEFLGDEYVSKYLEKIPLNPTQMIINKYPDKTTLFSVKITHFMEIERFIKSWIPRVVVIKPIELKNKILNDLKIYQNL